MLGKKDVGKRDCNVTDNFFLVGGFCKVSRRTHNEK
jgi:hypothetical protein